MFKEKVIQMSDLEYIELKIAYVIFFLHLLVKKGKQGWLHPYVAKHKKSWIKYGKGNLKSICWNKE